MNDIFEMAAMKSNSTGRKTNMFSHIRYEHMVAGFSGGVTSTLILHPLDLLKIRFAGMYNKSPLIAGPMVRNQQLYYFCMRI